MRAGLSTRHSWQNGYIFLIYRRWEGKWQMNVILSVVDSPPSAGVNKRVTMGLPPKYGKPPRHTTIPTAATSLATAPKHGGPSSWLNVEGSTSTGVQRGHPGHRRTASDSMTFFRVPPPPGTSMFFNAGNQTIANGGHIGGGGGGMNNILKPPPRDSGVGNKMIMMANANLSPPLDDKNPIRSDGGVVGEGSSDNNEAGSDVIRQYKWGGKDDPNMDPKKYNRILANRLSARKSRLKKIQYKAELEKKLEALQAQVGTLGPEVAKVDRERLVLRMDNSSMRQRVAFLMNDKMIKEAKFEMLKKESEKLREQLFILQQQHPQHGLSRHGGAVGREQAAQNQQRPNPTPNANLDFFNCLI